MSVWLPDDSVLVDNPDVLKSSLARYQRLLYGDGYAFWEWNLNDGTYLCAGSFWKKLGYEDVDKTLSSINEAQEYVHPDDFAFVLGTIKEHLSHNKPINMIYRIRAADGTYWWTQASASSTRDASGRVTYLTGINFDLSHLKDTEKALRLSEARHERVLAASNDGIWEWSATDGNKNPAKAGVVGKFHTSYSFWKHLGYTEAEVDSLPESERMSVWKSHIHPHDLEKMRANLMRCFATREPLDLEYRMFGEKGKMFWMRTRGNGIFNNHGRMILISGINIDITEVKESEERVNKAKEDAERANRSKSNFLSSMSHELRTPLNAILGFSRLLSADATLDPSQVENAEYINDAGQHLLRLINDVLDLAQIEAGKLSLSAESVFPSPLVEESINYCRSIAGDKKIGLYFDDSGLSDKFIQVDPVRLRQCLLNLISNAVKYNVHGGSVNVIFKDQSGDLEISVNDTGPGIPKEKQSALFEMFNRLGAERSSVEGSGLGLVLTKQLVTAMGGVLSYCDESAPGASFKILFPIAGQADSLDAPLEQLSDDKPKNINLTFSESKKIFYVEDNKSNIRLMESLMRPSGQLLLLSETDPFLGLYKIRNTLPDMILLDINLPGISGYDLLKILKQDVSTRHLPVVALSASAMAKDVERGLEEGFDAYLTKPLDIEELSGVLNRLFTKEEAVA
ncbi:MAG: PAS domain-containing protein [Cellvibrionaceae bacterium]